MKLYHGASKASLRKVLRDGLKPRGRRKGNWEHSVSSCPKAVYLTNAYALHYALASLGPKERDGVIFEVDSEKLFPFWFAPDEDFLEQATRDHPDFAKERKQYSTMEEATAYFRDNLPKYSYLWRASLEYLGNCCYMGGIPPSAITRYAIVPDVARMVRWSDPTITLQNFRFCGDYYRDLSAMVFGQKPENPDKHFMKLPTQDDLGGIIVKEVKETCE